MQGPGPLQQVTALQLAVIPALYHHAKEGMLYFW
jgi:hypothetical protein